MDWSLLDKKKRDGEVSSISPKEAYWAVSDQQERKVVLVDVRTEGELSFSGTPPGSINVVWSSNGVDNPNFLKELGKLVPSKSDALVFMCRSGVRSMRAAVVAIEAGYEAVYNVDGGFNGISAELPQWIESWR